jgi:hypothetical protein
MGVFFKEIRQNCVRETSGIRQPEAGESEFSEEFRPPQLLPK